MVLKSNSNPSDRGALAIGWKNLYTGNAGKLKTNLRLVLVVGTV